VLTPCVVGGVKKHFYTLSAAFGKVFFISEKGVIALITYMCSYCSKGLMTDRSPEA